mmetsp:Transcript_17512/g.37884  ORF Transcript_17512/g.37884 Transcript_17512/m.37884 type:complete len:415 (-) Transcript_17512:174-1418(-)|eukprot:CAMPEP_0172318356 /NCGR_PEP_ID=MMETSP1058-20130122/34690_1 /TAXON_ID=83371 /ORGANISM="Detonula confervacea, Strain CCMP 353" /LENGTH=414 /DNA_ID=CAMNT_0013033183 /DNA_START=21 /DNA_END=1265 /DNA_ORIENTATION=-
MSYSYYDTPVPLQEKMIDQAKLSAAGGMSPKPRSNQRLAQAGDDDITSTTINSSYICTDGCLSQDSTASSSCCATGRMRIHGHGASNDQARRRYLHRLGIYPDLNKPPAAHAHISSSSPTNGGSGLNFTSCSAPETASCMQKPSHSSLRQSLSHGSNLSSQQTGNRQGSNVILLRRSVQFTTQLKSDPKDVEKLSQPISSKLHEEENTDSQTPRSPPSKFELSSSWTTLLSKDTASTASASSGPLDGAYDLFSLPSESSIAASGWDSTRSLDNTIALVDRPPSRDTLSVNSMPKQRKVSFDSTVKATTIPSRLSYSNRISTRLWSSTENIYANAVRSEKEYAFDGSNWRTAREESDFLCCSSGQDEPIHPAHFSGWSSSQSSAQSPSARNREERSDAEQAEQYDDYSEGMFEMD